LLLHGDRHKLGNCVAVGLIFGEREKHRMLYRNGFVLF
jgi:hypothetical protein